MILKGPSTLSQKMGMVEETKQYLVKIFAKSLYFLSKILISFEIVLQGSKSHILEKF